MNLQRTMLNLRNAQRSNALRNETDPVKVAQNLEHILFEAINMQNTGSREFQLRALKELKQLRSDMTTGQINAGAKGNQYVGLYSHVIDQIDSLTKNSNAASSALTKGIGSIQNAMPSTDSLIAALMTANPIMGYGVKIMRDIAQSRKEGNAQRQAENKRRIAALRSEEEYIKTQLEQQEVQEEVLDGQADQVKKQKREYRRGGVYEPLLTEIRDEIKRLEEYWRGTSDTTSTSDTPVEEKLDEINETLLEQIEQMHEADEMAERNGRLERLRDGPEDSGIPELDTLGTQAQREDKKGGLLDMLIGAPLRALGVMFAGIVASVGTFFAAFAAGGILAKLLTPFKLLINFVVGIGKFALRLGSKLLLPVAVLVALFDFFDAFFNADEILGKKDADITLGDRVLLGISAVIARFAELFDSLLEMVGIDLFDSNGLTKTLYEFFDSIPARITDLINKGIEMWDGFTDSVVNAYDEVLLGINSIYETVVTTIKDAINTSIDKAKSIMDSITSTFTAVYDAIEAKIREWGQTLSKIPGIGDFFKVGGDEVKIDPVAMNKAATDLNDMTGTMNLLRVADGTATMIPLSTGSQTTGQTIQLAERATQVRAEKNPLLVNAPTTVSNNSATTVQSGNSTSNNNSIHRRMNDANYGVR